MDGPKIRAELDRARRSTAVALVLLLLAAGSSGCTRWSARRAPAAATAAAPTADELVAAINRNAARAHSLVARDLDISSNQVAVPLDGRLALEKPRRFRLVVQAPVTHSTVADVGSNDDEFWIYAAPPNQRPTLVHCSYEAYGRIRSPLPIQPDWILESLGFMPLPADEQYTLQPGRRGTVELRSPTTTPRGQPATLVTALQPNTAFIVERRLEVPGQQQPIARAVLSRHVQDPASGVVYPGTVAVSWPDENLEITIRLNNVEINPRFDAFQSRELWRLPKDVYVAEEVDLGTQAVPQAPLPRTPAAPRVRPSRPGSDLSR